MKTTETWNERLIRAIENRRKKRADINNADLAGVAGVKPSTFGYWVHKDPSKRSKDCGALPLLKVCKHLGLNPYWVIFNEGVMDVDFGDTKAVPCINDTSLLGITRDYPHAKAVIYKLTDENSFEPRIYENDLLFIDTAQTKLKSGKLYLFEAAGEHFLRRYFNNPVNQTYSLSSGDNEQPPHELSLPEFESVLKTMRIIGAVVGRYTNSL